MGCGAVQECLVLRKIQALVDNVSLYPRVIDNGLIVFKHLQGSEMLADGWTKPFATLAFKAFCEPVISGRGQSGGDAEGCLEPFWIIRLRVAGAPSGAS